MQSFFILKEPALTGYDISFKAGKRLMNRFCIDEDANFELTGVYSSYVSPRAITSKIGSKTKGKGNFIKNAHRIIRFEFNLQAEPDQHLGT